ncbi:MAG: glycosyltransferase [Myxococcota bacterium]
MLGPLPDVWFVAPGRFPDTRGTPLSIRWLAEAWAESGASSTVFTSGSPPEPAPSVPGVEVRRCGAPADPRPGLRLSRLTSTLRVAGALRRALKKNNNVVLHGHHVDGALAARLAAGVSGVPTVTQVHTRLSEELVRYSEGNSALKSCLGHVLDSVHFLSARQIVFNVTDLPGAIQIPPVVPQREILRIETCRSSPSSHPSAVYIGNPDGYQNLESLVRLAAQNPGLRVRCISHHAPTNAQWHAFRGRIEWLQTESVDVLLTEAARAWWGVCPRELFAGYPYKALSYVGLGLPTLAVHDWGQPVAWAPIERTLGLSSPPARVPAGALGRARLAGLEQLREVYRSAIL